MALPIDKLAAGYDAPGVDAPREAGNRRPVVEP